MQIEAELADQISNALRGAVGNHFRIDAVTPISGGDINRAVRIDCGADTYFVKYNKPRLVGMFEAEHDALQQIAATQTLKVPRPFCVSRAASYALLALEFLPLSHRRPNGRMLGEQLAALHAIPQNVFGWQRDNTIGSTPQINTQLGSWTQFWREARMLPQLQLAISNGAPAQLIELTTTLIDQLDIILADHSPQPSLLHGDLWAGNAGFLEDGAPVVYDPASYYGDRETDLAMTELFGGFDSAFYHAYFSVFPVDEGYKRRSPLYQLYHLFNHFNLFGGGYAAQCLRTIKQLLRTL